MDDQATVTNSDHVSSDVVIASDNFNDYPATPPAVDDTSQSS